MNTCAISGNRDSGTMRHWDVSSFEPLPRRVRKILLRAEWTLEKDTDRSSDYGLRAMDYAESGQYSNPISSHGFQILYRSIPQPCWHSVDKGLSVSHHSLQPP